MTEQEMFAQMDEIAGVSTPTPVVADPNAQAMRSRADEIRARGQQAQKRSLDTTSATEGRVVPAEFAADTTEGSTVLGETGKAIKNVPSSFGNVVTSTLKPIMDLPGEIKGAAKDFSNLAEAGGDVLKDAIMPFVDKATYELFNLPENILKGLFNKYGGQELIKGDIKGAVDAVHRTVVNDPVSVFLDLQGAKSLTKGALETAETGSLKEGVTAGRKALNEMPDTGILNTLKEVGTKGVKKIQDKAINALESNYSEWAEATKSGAQKVFKAGERTESLNKAGTTGKTPQRVLAEHQIVPETSGTKFSTAEQASNFRESTLPLVEARNQALQEVAYSTPPLELLEMEKVALKNASKRNLTASETESLLNDIHSEYDALRRKYGNTIEVTDLAGENSKYWGKTKFDSNKPFKGTSNYETGKSMQLAIQEVAEKAGYDDIAQLNREIGDRMEGAKFLQNLHGQTLSKGKLGKYVFMGIGASLGKTVAGKVLGTVAGDMVGQMLMDASVSNPVKRIILNSIKNKDIPAYQATLDWIKEQEILREGRLKLPSSETMITPEPAPRGTTAADKAANDAYFARQSDLNTLKLPPGSTDIRLPPPPSAGTPGPADMSALGQFSQSGELGITPFRKTIRRSNRSLKEIKGLKGY